jgi:hypothetical protein
LAVLPAPADRFWVYLVPAPTRRGVWPSGVDVRYLVAQDGRTIIARRRLHRSHIEFGPFDQDSTKQPEAGWQTAVLDNVPEDTDVFHVLTRSPKVPQYVVADAFVYRIDNDSRISLLGRRETVLGR